MSLDVENETNDTNINQDSGRAESDRVGSDDSPVEESDNASYDGRKAENETSVATLDKSSGPRGGIWLKRLSEFESKPVPWLWDGYIPIGELVNIVGEPEVGKSTLALDIAARVTSGEPFPRGIEKRPPANVILFSVENAIEYVLKPRLEAAGGDPSRVFLEDPDNSSLFKIGRDIKRLEELILQDNVPLVIVDSLMSNVGATDIYKDSEVRALLAPLQKLCSKTATTCILIRHLNKMEGRSAKGRGMGSTAWTAVPRVELLVAVDPWNRGDRVMAVNKNNLGPKAPSYRFTLDSKYLNGIQTSKIRWRDTCTLSADDLVKPIFGAGSLSKTSSRATEFLLDRLRDGPVLGAEILEEAEERDISGHCIRRAAKELGVEKKKGGEFGKGRSYWSLPGSPRQNRVESGEYSSDLVSSN